MDVGRTNTRKRMTMRENFKKVILLKSVYASLKVRWNAMRIRNHFNDS